MSETIRVETSMRQWGVGHGGFHTQETRLAISGNEQTIRFIYDCGSRTAPQNLKPSIANYVQQIVDSGRPKIVDLIVLSHLDADHVSGLPELSSQLRAAKITVKKVVIPPLTQHQRLALWVDRSADFAGYSHLFFSPAEALKQMFGDATQVVELEAAETRMDAVQGIAGVTLTSDSGEEVWQVIPYVVGDVEDEANLATFFEAMKRELSVDPSLLSEGDLLKFVTRNRTCLKALIEKHVTSINNTSVCLWAGTNLQLNPDSGGFLLHQSEWQIDTERSGPFAWLGTGDACLKGPEAVARLRRLYGDERLQVVGVVGAPHHGSVKDSSSEFYRLFRQGTRVTVHARHPFSRHHPHEDVTKAIADAGLIQVNVSQGHGHLDCLTIHEFTQEDAQ